MRWEDNAACRTSGFSPDVWYPDAADKATAEDARGVCRECKVRDQCLDAAVRRGERFGIHGGFNLANDAEWKRAEAERKIPAPKPTPVRADRVRREVQCDCGVRFGTRRRGAVKCPQCMQGLVDIAPTRQRVRELRAAGWTSERIASAAGLSPSSVRGIDYKVERDWVNRGTEQRILAIQVPVAS